MIFQKSRGIITLGKVLNGDVAAEAEKETNSGYSENSEWSKAIIIPLHKKGDVNDPDNYRGILLKAL